MESLEGMTCGVDNHDPECLCDVVISQETVIDPVAVRGMWMGQEVADANGYENWDNPQEVLNYLCDILFLHDCYDFQQRYCQDTIGKREQIRPRDSDGYVHKFSIIRVTMREAMSTEGATIAQALRDSGITSADFTRAISAGHWELDEPTLIRFEHVITTEVLSIPELMRRFGMKEGAVRNLLKYWPNRKRKSGRKSGQPHQKRMRELVSQGVSNKEILRILKDEFDVSLTSAAVSRTRERMK
jgi:hypothetical protein